HGQRAAIQAGQQASVARLADGPPKTAAPPAPAPTTARAPAPTAAPKAAEATAGQPPAPPPAKAGPPEEKEAADPKETAEAAPKGKKAAAPEEKGAKAPAEGDGLQAVVAGVQQAGQEQKQHDSPEQKAEEAKQAVGVSPEAAAGEGKRQQVAAMAGQKPQAFNREEFKKRLREKIQTLQAADAKDIKDEDKAGNLNAAVKGEVASGKQAAAAGIDQAAKQPPPAGTPVPGAELPKAEAGAAPKVDGSRAVPPPVPEEKTTLAPQSAALDERMAA